MITVLPPVMGPDALDPLSPEAVGGDTRLASQQQIRMSVGGFDGTSGCVGRPGRAGRHAPAVELLDFCTCRENLRRNPGFGRKVHRHGHSLRQNAGNAAVGGEAACDSRSLH